MNYSDSWEEAKNLVKERADIVEIIGEQVDLKRSGFRFIGSCPFHQEKTPSFTVHPGQQFYHCFGCKASGDVFSFMMDYHRMDFPEALKTLARRYQVDLPEKRRSPRELEAQRRQDRMYDLNDRVAAVYQAYLEDAEAAEAARAYLRKRGIGAELQRRYQLGYAPGTAQAGWHFLGSRLDGDERRLAVEVGLLVEKDPGRSYDRFRDRIMFPIFTARGRVCGFGGRILGDGEPKYLNSPDSAVYTKSRSLFGFYQQKDAIRSRRRAVLVEGNFDLLALVAGGFEPVAAPLGTALTREQLRQLKPLADEVVLLFDGDSAGRSAAERSVVLFLSEQMSGRVALLPPEHDPDTFIRAFGPDRVTELIETAAPLPEFVIERLRERHGDTLDGKFKIIEAVKPLLDAVGSAARRDALANHFGAALHLDPDRLLAESRPGPEAPAPAGRPDDNGRAAEKLMPEGTLRSILGFMVLNPSHFEVLQNEGIEEALQGTVGETIGLQLKTMREQGRRDVLPEELFAELPPGEERALVAALMTDPGVQAPPVAEQEEAVDELAAVLNWLRRRRLESRSEELMQAIREAEQAADFELISSLMQEKMELDRGLKNNT